MSDEITAVLKSGINNSSFGMMETDGFFITNVAKKMKEDNKDLTDEAVDSIISNAADVLNHCPNPIDKGEIKKTGLMIGKVQSGKTSNFISVLALAFDNGYNIGIVIGGNTTELLNQNTERIRSSFNVNKEYLVVLNSKENEQLINSNDVRDFLTNGQKVIIVCLKSPQEKNKKHMSEVLQIFDDQFLSNQTTLIIDDEGDQATLNSFSNSKKVSDTQLTKRLSSTYRVAIEFKNKIKRHCFLSVTATPQANILIKTDDILSPDFCCLIPPGKGYCGLAVFHGQEQKKYIKEIPDNEDSLIDADSGIPDSFKQALAAFFVSNAIRRSRGDDKTHSMLIHPSVKKFDHEYVAKKVNKLVKNWKEIVLYGKTDLSYQKGLKPQLLKAYKMYEDDGLKLLSFEELEDQILECIRKSSKALIFNSDNSNAKKDAENFNTRIYLGGTILDRGITIDGLAITYIIRRAKGTANVDNTEQRARWFGYKSKYIDICRVWATKAIIDDFSAIAESDEDMWASISRHIASGKSFKEMARLFILQNDASHKLRLTRPSVAKTEEVSWTEWKKQKYYQKDEDKANHNLELLESMKTELEPNCTLRDFGAAQKDLFAYDVNLPELLTKYFDNFIFDSDENIRIDVVKKICEIRKNKNEECKADIVWLRIQERESRTIRPDFTFNNIFQPYNEKYKGDARLCDEHPDRIQIQIHYVKPMNEEKGTYYSPALAIYIPDGYAKDLVGQKND
ncbi:MAG: hypothetical protein J5710_02590 [Treponema sp.]|nr:hypothetical protein [Treponema sp.]MBR5647009.1 hypothetical protein [Treponema sp.]